MEDKEMEEYLMDILKGKDEVLSIINFEERGMFTDKKGIIIRMKDRSEFNVLIVKTLGSR